MAVAVARRAVTSGTFFRIRSVAGARRWQSTVSRPNGEDIQISGTAYQRDGLTNTPPSILDKVGRGLHQTPGHPLHTLKSIIESHFSTHKSFSPESPAVTVFQNFDQLGFPPDHPGRSPTDSYYLNKTHMLRTHTSAHEVECYTDGGNAWLIAADVYRRDEIDRSHYPVFHQMEGMRIWDPTPEALAKIKAENEAMATAHSSIPLVIEDVTTGGTPENPFQVDHDPELAAAMSSHLKHSLNGLIFALFGKQATADGEPLRIRWIDAQFPWTSPSYECEVWFNNDWLEILGCGVVMQDTLKRSDIGHKVGWAFGLGLERIAMVLFGISDIRLFWSADPRFLGQWQPGEIKQFAEYSKYPPCYKDMSFWLAEKDGWLENDYCEIVRDVAGDLVETVELIDDFTHPKNGRRSLCYRLNYRSMDRSLQNEEVNELQDKVILRVVNEMGIEMR